MGIELSTAVIFCGPAPIIHFTSLSFLPGLRSRRVRPTFGDPRGAFQSPACLLNSPGVFYGWLVHFQANKPGGKYLGLGAILDLAVGKKSRRTELVIFGPFANLSLHRLQL